MNILVLIVGLMKLFLLVNANEATADISTRIIGGKFANPKQFPGHVHLDARINITNANRTATGSCGGALISKNYVLTAAHCIHVNKLKLVNGKAEEIPNQFTLVSKLYVFFGVHDLNKLKEYQRVIVKRPQNYILHPNYDPVTLQNDIALIHLPKAVSFNEFVQPFKLPSIGVDYSGIIAITTGFGDTSSSNIPSKPSILKYVGVRILPNILCNARPTKMCTDGFGSRGTCKGDSGGPLMIKSGNDSILVGISSSGSDNCENGAPSYYIRVSEYLNWIKNTTGI